MSYPTSNVKYVSLSVRIPDVSTGDEVGIASPIAGRVRRITTHLEGTIANADADLTPKIAATQLNSGGSGATITLTASGSALGDTTVTDIDDEAASDVKVGEALRVETDGASTNAIACVVTFLVEQA
jgi:hypothetical protein